MRFRQLLLSFTSVLTPFLASANFEPGECFWELDPTVFALLEKPSHNLLIDQVSAVLANSWCSAEKARLLVDTVTLLQPQLCVEVGAGTGSTCLPVVFTLMENGKGRLVAVDGWDNQLATRYMSDSDPNKAWWQTVSMKEIEAMFDQLMLRYGVTKRVEKLKMPSKEAAKKFVDIDFLHLDGDHTEQGALEDVLAWLPDVRQGGYILISNLNVQVDEVKTKQTALDELRKHCTETAVIEQGNAILLRKN
ncbi:MAG: class I SAM-dependent methyltransferase [Chlamydiia bacterium]